MRRIPGDSLRRGPPGADLRHGARWRIAAAAAAGLLLEALLPISTSAQQSAADSMATTRGDSTATLHGTISVAGSGEPLPSASVRLVGRGRVAVADSAGAYRFRNVRPGEVTVRISYLGTRADDRPVTLEPGEEKRLDVTANRTAVEVAELRVEVERARRGRLAGFERRREQGRGRYITREDFERVNPLRTTQIIRMRDPSARIVRRGLGDHRLLLRGATGRCPPAVFLDGALTAGLRVNDVHPSDIAAMELYDATEVPPEYKTMQGCGAVLIWTRTGL